MWVESKQETSCRKFLEKKNNRKKYKEGVNDAASSPHSCLHIASVQVNVESWDRLQPPCLWQQLTSVFTKLWLAISGMFITTPALLLHLFRCYPEGLPPDYHHPISSYQLLHCARWTHIFLLNSSKPFLHFFCSQAGCWREWKEDKTVVTVVCGEGWGDCDLSAVEVCKQKSTKTGGVYWV